VNDGNATGYQYKEGVSLSL